MNRKKIIEAGFFESDTGRIPVREWLLSLSKKDRTAIGQAIAHVEFKWPVGMPDCRGLSGNKGLWEVRVSLENGRIARVFFCFHNKRMVLLHGFEKKSQKTPQKEIETAVKRQKGLK